jgi:hypothetical protein
MEGTESKIFAGETNPILSLPEHPVIRMKTRKT